MKRTFSILLLFAALTSCSINDLINNKKDVTADNQIESRKEEPTSQGAIFNEFSILIAADAINIRRDPSTTSKENIIDQVHMGETYTVYEQIKDSEYTWYRIGEDRWIANDGTWCIEYDEEGNKDYPHVLNETETINFLSMLETDTHALSSGYDLKAYYLNFFHNPGIYGKLSECNILFSIDGKDVHNAYKYDVSNIVQMDSNTYDIYVVPIENDGIEDNSTGVFRIANIGTYTGDGNINDQRLCFDMTLIQNNNASDDEFEKLYNMELHFMFTGQVAF